MTSLRSLTWPYLVINYLEKTNVVNWNESKIYVAMNYRNGYFYVIKSTTHLWWSKYIQISSVQ